MEYRPCIVERTSFSEITAPPYRAEVRIPASVLLAASHQTIGGAEDIRIITCALAVEVNFRLGATQLLGDLPYTPIIVSIFKGSCHTFADVDVAGHIAEFVVRLEAETT